MHVRIKCNLNTNCNINLETVNYMFRICLESSNEIKQKYKATH